MKKIYSFSKIFLLLVNLLFQAFLIFDYALQPFQEYPTKNINGNNGFTINSIHDQIGSLFFIYLLLLIIIAFLQKTKMSCYFLVAFASLTIFTGIINQYYNSIESLKVANRLNSFCFYGFYLVYFLYSTYSFYKYLRSIRAKA